MDRDFAAALQELEEPGEPGEVPISGPPPPAAPAGPPPGQVLPPRRSRVVLPRLPPEAYQVRKGAIYLKDAARPIGRESAMLHWCPPSASMRCLHPDHRQCSLTADCTGDAVEALRNWVAHANDFPDAAAHRAAAPDCVRGELD